MSTIFLISKKQGNSIYFLEDKFLFSGVQIWYLKMRFNKARPPGELRRKAVRGLFYRNIRLFCAILSAISPLRHHSEAKRFTVRATSPQVRGFVNVCFSNILPAKSQFILQTNEKSKCCHPEKFFLLLDYPQKI